MHGCCALSKNLVIEKNMTSLPVSHFLEFVVWIQQQLFNTVHILQDLSLHDTRIFLFSFPPTHQYKCAYLYDILHLGNFLCVMEI